MVNIQFFFEDTGEASYLMALAQHAPNVIQDQLRFAWSNLRVSAQQLYPGEHEFYQYRTRGGAEVDLVLKTKKSNYGYIFIPNEEIPPKALGSANAFIKKHPGAKIFIVYPKSINQNLAVQIKAIGINSILDLK